MGTDDKINPGTGPIEGATLEHACANIAAFIRDLGLAGVEAMLIKPDDDGRFTFRLARPGVPGGRMVDVRIPGLPLERVRFSRSNPAGIPRLYVNGSSWLWCYALNCATEALDGVQATDDKRPLTLDIATAKTSELLVLLDPDRLVVCLFGPNGEGMSEDRDAAKAEIARVQRLVIDEIDRRIPVPAPADVVTAPADENLVTAGPQHAALRRGFEIAVQDAVAIGCSLSSDDFDEARARLDRIELDNLRSLTPEQARDLACQIAEAHAADSPAPQRGPADLSTLEHELAKAHERCERRASWAPFNTPFAVAADALRSSLERADGKDRTQADYVLAHLETLAQATHHYEPEARRNVYEFTFDDGTTTTVRIGDRLRDMLTFTLTGPPLATIAPGLYRLHWKAGGSSLAAVGRSWSGEPWYAASDGVGGTSTNWSLVEGATLIEAGPNRSGS